MMLMPRRTRRTRRHRAAAAPQQREVELLDVYNGPDLGTLQGVQPEAERNAFMRLAKLVSVRPQSTTNDSPHSREKSTRARARPYVARTVSVIRPGVRRAASGAYLRCYVYLY